MAKKQPTWTTTTWANGRLYKAELTVDYRKLVEIMAAKASQSKHMRTKFAFGTVELRLRER